MTPKEFSYPSELADAVIDEYGETHMSLFGALPDRALVVRLLEVAYHASMTAEEGRSAFVSIVFDEERAFGTGPWGGQPVSFLDAPVSFDVEQVRRLSPVVHPDRSAIVVAVDDSGAMKIHAVLGFGDDWVRMPSGDTTSATVPPGILRVGSRGPGSLAVFAGGLPMASLRSGEVSRGRISLDSELEVYQRLLGPSADRLARDVEVQVSGSTGDTPSAEHMWSTLFQRDGARMCLGRFLHPLMQRLIDGVASGGHGGTVVILAADDVSSAPLQLKYPSSRMELWDHLAYWIALLVSTDPGEESSRLNETVSHVNDVASLICDLTAVDGAVVLDQSFELMGFGAEFTASVPVDEVERRSIRGGFHPELLSAEGWGTRHRSAFRLATECPGSLAIVASQDGGARLVEALDGQVILWDDLTIGRRRRI